MDFEIKKNVPMPEKFAKACKYPFHSMEIGDSFDAPIGDRQKVYCAASKHTERHGGKFSTRKISDTTITVWRIA